MKKRWLLISMLVVLSNAHAGFGYKSLTSSSGVAVPVKLDDKTMYNLVINLDFLNQPYDRKPYDTSHYSELINRLKVEWSGIAIQTVLERPNVKLTELSGLQQAIESKIDSLVANSKKKHNITPDTEVVYSISSFFIVKPN